MIYVDGDTGRAYSYHDVKTAGRAFGEGLKATWRWRKGDVLALFSPNSIDTPALTWGCHWAGGVVSPANAGYTVGELAFQLRDTGAKALVTQWPLIHTARQAARDVGLPDDRIILLGDQRDPHGTFKHFDSIRNLSSVEHFPRATIQPEHDLAFLVYSSGTTGM